MIPDSGRDESYGYMDFAGPEIAKDTEINLVCAVFFFSAAAAAASALMFWRRQQARAQTTGLSPSGRCQVQEKFILAGNDQNGILSLKRKGSPLSDGNDSVLDLVLACGDESGKFRPSRDCWKSRTEIAVLLEIFRSARWSRTPDWACVRWRAKIAGDTSFSEDCPPLSRSTR